MEVRAEQSLRALLPIVVTGNPSIVSGMRIAPIAASSQSVMVIELPSDV
tara:strand:- start:678 stop:824 length:147 start_codon:yes stop_codon:yes gene_type:complete